MCDISKLNYLRETRARKRQPGVSYPGLVVTDDHLIAALEAVLKERELCGICEHYRSEHSYCHLAGDLPRRNPDEDPNDYGWPAWVQDPNVVVTVQLPQAFVRNCDHCHFVTSAWEPCRSPVSST